MRHSTLKHGFTCLAAAALVLACGGTNSELAQPASSPSDHSAPRPAFRGEESAPKTATGGAFDAPATEGESRSFQPAPSQAPEPDLRPGLATLWGEDRSSNITFTAFVRATPSQPVAVASFFYNDRDGVREMASRSGISDFGDSGHSSLGGAVSVRILDEDGDPYPGFEIGSREYVVGEGGDRYTISIENHTRARLEAVATVDGLDVVDGEIGSFAKRGYIVPAFGSVEIDGFRRSESTVAAFRFGAVHESYAARKGEDRNVGVIGVAFFNEVGSSPWTDAEVERRHTADPFPGRFATPPSN
jgi:hypothetical protein